MSELKVSTTHPDAEKIMNLSLWCHCGAVLTRAYDGDEDGWSIYLYCPRHGYRGCISTEPQTGERWSWTT